MRGAPTRRPMELPVHLIKRARRGSTALRGGVLPNDREFFAWRAEHRDIAQVPEERRQI